MNEVTLLVNKYRESKGLHALKEHDALMKAAQKHSDDQAANRRMSHDGSDGSNPFQRMAAAGYRWAYAGECVGRAGDATTIVNMWISDLPHRRILLGTQYTHIGVGVTDGFWTTDYANGMADSPLPMNFDLW